MTLYPSPLSIPNKQTNKKTFPATVVQLHSQKTKVDNFTSITFKSAPAQNTFGTELQIITTLVE